MANAAAEKWLRYTGAELAGRNVTIVHDARELQSRSDQLTRAMGMPVAGGYQALITKAKYGVADEFECTYVRKDGTRFPVLLAVTALRGGGNDLAGYLMISADLSERHAIRKMKDEFVSVRSAQQVHADIIRLRRFYSSTAASPRVSRALLSKRASMSSIFETCEISPIGASERGETLVRRWPLSRLSMYWASVSRRF